MRGWRKGGMEGRKDKKRWSREKNELIEREKKSGRE